MILLNFFRAEAERQKNNNEKSNIIYAIEEPETSQHQYYQRLLMQSLKKLSKKEGIQIILTTHSTNVIKQLQFEDIRVIKNSQDNIKEIVKLEKHVLPIPSLNEINYLAFDEADEEYHNELYGYIDLQNLCEEYIKNKSKRKYIKITKNNNTKEENITTTEYIRHQIHHPENKHNEKFTFKELQQSIKDMRDFIQVNKEN